MSTEAWNNIQSASYKISKNGVSNSYFIKIKTFWLQASNLLWNRRKTYILDVICNRYYFGEVQEQVLDQCSGQGISAPRNGLSVCQFQKEKKQGSWGNAFVNTPLKFLDLSWKFWKNQSSLQVWFHKSVKTLANTKAKNSGIVVHIMNSARVCWIIKGTVFNVYVCLNHSWRYEQNQFKRLDEKPRHQRQFFQNLDYFYISLFTCNFH